MGEIPKSYSTSQLVIIPLQNEKYLTKMKLLKSIVFVCLFLAGMINLQSGQLQSISSKLDVNNLLNMVQTRVFISSRDD